MINIPGIDPSVIGIRDAIEGNARSNLDPLQWRKCCVYLTYIQDFSRNPGKYRVRMVGKIYQELPPTAPYIALKGGGMRDDLVTNGLGGREKRPGIQAIYGYPIATTCVLTGVPVIGYGIPFVTGSGEVKLVSANGFFKAMDAELCQAVAGNTVCTVLDNRNTPTAETLSNRPLALFAVWDLQDIDISAVLVEAASERCMDAMHELMYRVRDELYANVRMLRSADLGIVCNGWGVDGRLQ